MEEILLRMMHLSLSGINFMDECHGSRENINTSHGMTNHLMKGPREQRTFAYASMTCLTGLVPCKIQKNLEKKTRPIEFE